MTILHDILQVTLNAIKYSYYKAKFNNAPFSIGVVYRDEDFDIVNGHRSDLTESAKGLYQKIQSEVGCKNTYTILYGGTDCGYRFRWISELAGIEPTIVNINSGEIHSRGTGFCYSTLDVCLSIHINRNNWYQERVKNKQNTT